ncbi:MAG: DUF4143 domain-containing protein [Elusimicrobia bacterium]|jgi:predicted AAA+ superfamily ATPase|nr:DUF4143 domain-containing protein [Elusimicrobiota bacterium]
MKYLKRVVDSELDGRLSAIGAVVIEGPKACGKTTTARQVAASEVLFDVDRNARETVKIEPELVLAGEVPRLIDEWQLETEIWNYIRRSIDERNQPGQYILTGSAVPADDITRHSGAGRLTRLHMRTMTLFESGYSTGEISLKKIFNGQAQKCKDPGLTVQNLAEYISVGGWPVNIELNVENSIQNVRDYLEEIRRLEISQSDRVKREPEKVGRMLKSLARNIATTATVSTIAADTGGTNGALHDDTVREYLDALTRIKIYEEQPAWAPHLRSKSRLRKSPKIHFVDPSLAVAALRGTPEKLLKDIRFFGFLFESMVIRDLRVYSQAFGGRVFHYRDNTGLEVDAIVETPEGRWGAFEIKLGKERINDGAESLLKFVDKVDTKKCGEPEILGVIVGKGYGYSRKDGVEVIPIGALGP